MKKMLSVLLILVLALSLVACGGKPCEDGKHIDEDGDGICDNKACLETLRQGGTELPWLPVEPEWE